MNEFARIEKIFAPLAKNKAALSLLDDAAIFEVATGSELVCTKDAIVSGVHFIGGEPAEKIAKKLLRVNLSDLAAMGATPIYYMLAVMLPKECDEKWLGEFAKGLLEDQAEFGISLIGGDSTASPNLAFSLTAFGTVPAGKALKRSGAKIHDDVFVTGTIGDAMLGLKIAKSEPVSNLSAVEKQFALSRYYLPQPRNLFAISLRDKASSAIDISDGLIQDAGHIAKASNVGIKIFAEKIPLSSAVEKSGVSIEECVSAGDDYELLFTAPKGFYSQEATLIGEVVSGCGVSFINKDGEEIFLEKTGYQH